MKFFYFGKFGKHNTERYIAEALESEGHNVYRAHVDNYIYPKQLLRDIDDMNADIFLCTKVNPVFDLSVVLERLEIPSVCWLFDLYIDAPENLGRSLKAPFFKCNIVFSTDGGHNPEFHQAGINHRVLRQGIYSKEHIDMPSHKEIDVAFIGSSFYPYRQELHNFLKKTYKHRYKRFGLESEVRGLALNELLGKIKVVVGDSVPTPYYWSNRLYEICGRGGFMIFPEIKGLKDEMPDIVTYKWGDFDEMKDLIDHYVHGEKQRERIRRKCFEKCSEYTYEERVKEFLKQL